jgi:hypothetical protein
MASVRFAKSASKVVPLVSRDDGLNFDAVSTPLTKKKPCERTLEEKRNSRVTKCATGSGPFATVHLASHEQTVYYRC